MAARSAAPTGVNWSRLATISGVVCLICVGSFLLPQALCAFQELDRVALPVLGDGELGQEQSDAVRATDGAFKNFRRSVAACTERNPIGAAPAWQIWGGSLGLVFTLLFLILGRVAYRRQVRIAAARQRQARKSIRKERDSRGSGSAGFAVVPRESGSGAPPLQSSPLSAMGTSALEDPLAGLDAEFGRQLATGSASIVASDQLDPVATKSGTAHDSSAAASTRTAGRTTGAHAHAPSTAQVPAARTASDHDIAFEHTIAPAPDPVPAPLPALEELTDAGWEAFDAEPVITRSPRSVTGALKTDDVALAQTAPSVDFQVPAGSTNDGGFDSDGSAELDGVDAPNSLRVGHPLEIRIRGTSITAASPVHVAVTIEGMSGERMPIWAVARQVANAGAARFEPAGVLVSIPWRELARATLTLSRREDDSAITAHVSVSFEGARFQASTPIIDEIAFEVRDPSGALVAPTTVLVTSALGRVVRGWVGREEPGVARIGGLEPGRCKVEFEDAAPIAYPGETMRRSVRLSTNGVAFDASHESEQRNGLHALETPMRTVCYVSPRADAALATGARLTPFASITEALDRLGDVASANHVVEIRVDPTATLPTNRHGIVVGDDGRSNWVDWWTGRAADASASWSEDMPIEDLRRAGTPEPGLSLRENVALERRTNIRIVNSGYAELRERLATTRDPAFDLHGAFGEIPLAVLESPSNGPGAPFRITVEGCSGVLIEGFHLLGCTGQSGLAIKDSRAVTVRRCWIEAFSSGPSGRNAIFGVGRGLQVDSSGAGSEDDVVVIAICDIGWNRAARRSVPIRGAGVAIYGSRVELLGCYVHHNTATDAPADVAVQGESHLRGDANHRADNRVVQTT